MNNNNIRMQARQSPAKLNARISSAGTNANGRKRVRVRTSVRCALATTILVAGGTTNLDIIVDRGVTLAGPGTIVTIGDSTEITGSVGLQIQGTPGINDTSFTVAAGPIVTGKWYWIFDLGFVETHALTLAERLCQGQLLKTTTITNATKTAATSIPFKQNLVRTDLDSIRALDVTSRVCESVTWTGGKIKGTRFDDGCLGMYIGLTYNCTVSNVKTLACHDQSIYAGRSYGLTISNIRVIMGAHGAPSDTTPGGYGVEISRTNYSTVSNVIGAWTRYCVSLSEGSSSVAVSNVGTDYMTDGHASVDIHGGFSEDCTFTNIITPNADLRIGNSSWRFGVMNAVATSCTINALHIMGNDQNSTYTGITAQKLRFTFPLEDDPLGGSTGIGVTNVTVASSTFTCQNTANDRAFFVDDAITATSTTGAGFNSLNCNSTTFAGVASVYQAAYIGKLPPGTSSTINFNSCTMAAGPSGHAVAHNVDTVALTLSGDSQITFADTLFKVSAADRKAYYSSSSGTYAAPISQIVMDGATIQVGASAPVNVDSSWVTRGTGGSDYPELFYT